MPLRHREFTASSSARNDPESGYPLRRAFLASQKRAADRGPAFDARSRYKPEPKSTKEST